MRLLKQIPNLRNIFSVKRRFSRPGLLFFLPALLILLSDPSNPRADATHQRGPSFSDPNQTVSMPLAWKKQRVKYKPSHRDADLVVSLGQQTYPMFQGAVRFFAWNRSLKIVIESGSCGSSAGKLKRKQIHIGAFCCPPGETDRLPGLLFHTLGIAPIAILVNKKNPLVDITTLEARRLFRGKYNRWSELSDPASRIFTRRIQLTTRLHCKIRPGHWRLLLKHSDLFSPHIREVGVIPDMITRVANSPGAAGYETPYMVEHYDVRQKVKILRINGKSPNDDKALMEGRYPMYRAYSLTTWEGNSPRRKLARELVRFLAQYAEAERARFRIVPAARLREAGWKFKGEELIASPRK